MQEQLRLKIVKYWANRFGIENGESFLVFTTCFSNQELCRPFVVEDLLNNVEAGLIKKRYGITTGQLRTVQMSLGLRKNFKRAKAV